MDATCGENDPNGVMYDPRHDMYHVFFQDGLFELADTWLESLTADAYARFLLQLFRGVTCVDDAKPCRPRRARPRSGWSSS